MEDTIKLPLDADGVPIRPGDVVYVRLAKKPEPQKVATLIYRNAAHCWVVGLLAPGAKEERWVAECLTHTKPGALETIEASIRELIELSEEDALSEIPRLMERIKRMVER